MHLYVFKVIGGINALSMQFFCYLEHANDMASAYFQDFLG